MIWLAYAVMCLIWGTTWYAIKIGLHAMGPLTSLGLRFVIAGLLLYALAAARGKLVAPRLLPWKLIANLAVFTVILDYGLIYTAETHLASGLVAILFATLPFFSFAFARVMLGERTTRATVAGGFIAFAGVTLISISAGIGGSPLYALAAVAAAAFGAFGNVYAKGCGDISPFVALPPAMLMAERSFSPSARPPSPRTGTRCFRVRRSPRYRILPLPAAASRFACFSGCWRACPRASWGSHR